MKYFLLFLLAGCNLAGAAGEVSQENQRFGTDGRQVVVFDRSGNDRARFDLEPYGKRILDYSNSLAARDSTNGLLNSYADGALDMAVLIILERNQVEVIAK